MTHAAKILADSVSPDGVRLTTMEVTIPRIVLAEFNTHRMFSRNSASSRAIPVKRMIERVLDDPYTPSEWGKNQKGMQAGELLPEREVSACKAAWLGARLEAVAHAERLLDLGVHKQLTNRLLEPFMWHTVIVTATEWSNFFHLRCHPAAHPDIRIAAELMRRAMAESAPRFVKYGEWHLPLYDRDGEDREWMIKIFGDWREAIKISVGRCARVSYLTHDGKRDPAADIALHDRLLESGHMSPFEHVARPLHGAARRELVSTHDYDNAHRIDFAGEPASTFAGNFRGWLQYRKTLPGEADILAPGEADILASGGVGA